MSIHGAREVATVTMRAGLLSAVAFCVLSSVAFAPFYRIEKPGFGGEVILSAVLAASVAAGAWRMFRSLRAHYPHRETRAMTITFAVFLPILMAIGLLVGPLTGELASDAFGAQSGAIAFAGAWFGASLFVVLTLPLPVMLAFWMTRRSTELEQHDPPEEG